MWSVSTQSINQDILLIFQLRISQKNCTEKVIKYFNNWKAFITQMYKIVFWTQVESKSTVYLFFSYLWKTSSILYLSKNGTICRSHIFPIFSDSA